MFLTIHLAAAATLAVGPSGTYATPCAAIAAAAPGDVVEVDAAGDYAGDTCAWSTDALTIRGVNGRPVLDGTGASLAQQKGIFVVQAPTATIENLEFVGAAVADANGAGIRHQGTDLVVRDCVFRDNENGILGSPTADGTGTVLIERSEFAHNGHGDGYSHNLYLGHYAEVEFRASYSHAGNVGHLFKSRALVNRLVASRFTDEAGGQASYEIDLPNAGEAWIVGCLVEQVATTENSAMISYGAETSGMNDAQDLHVVNSTLVNHHDRGVFLSVGAPIVEPIQVVNTLFVGPGTLSTQAAAELTTCWDDSMGDASVTDAAALDLTLQAGSPCIDAGSAPPVDVDAQYRHPLAEEGRGVGGSAIDIGAFEFENPGLEENVGEGDTAGEDDDSADGPPPACGCDAGGRPPALVTGVLAAALWARRARRTPRGARHTSC